MSKSLFQNGWSFLYIVYSFKHYMRHFFLSLSFQKPQSRLLYFIKKLWEFVSWCNLFGFCLFVCLFVCLKTLPTSCAWIMEVGVQPFVGHFVDLLQIAGFDIVDKMSQVTLQQTKHIVTRDSSWQELPFTIIYRGLKELSHISPIKSWHRATVNNQLRLP